MAWCLLFWSTSATEQIKFMPSRDFRHGSPSGEREENLFHDCALVLGNDSHLLQLEATWLVSCVVHLVQCGFREQLRFVPGCFHGLPCARPSRPKRSEYDDCRRRLPSSFGSRRCAGSRFPCSPPERRAPAGRSTPPARAATGR